MNRILADVGGENGVGHGQGRALDPAAPSACSDRGIHVLGGENGLVLDPISLPQAPPELRGRRVVLREGKPSDIDDRLAFPIAPEDEDMFGGSWRREWRGELRHTRENLEALAAAPGPPGHVDWAVEHARRSIGWAGLRIDSGNHRASYTVGIFDPMLRGRGLGREITTLVVEWAFHELGLHRVELEVLTSNAPAIRCYEAVGFRYEGVRLDFELYPDGWRDFLSMALLETDPRPPPAGPSDRPARNA
jgi:RimJ/RimL family protein N-acetyltransferase